jgi:hypothetical protein
MDAGRRLPTKPVWSLAPVQYSAINLLCNGNTIPETAALLSLPTAAVYEWMRLPGFIAAINSRRNHNLGKKTAVTMRQGLTGKRGKQ